MPAFMAQHGMPYWIDLMSSDVRKSAHFYSELLGWEFEETVPGYRLARCQGLPVAGLIAQPEDSNAADLWVTHFLADDIEATVAQARELGGAVCAPPTEVQLGSMALLADPAGALFGVIEPHSEEAFVAGGEPGTAVWHELTCTNHYVEAVEFYSELFGWATASIEGAQYTTALADGAAFAGVWGGPESHVPSFWSTYVGVKDAGAACEKAVALGGEVVREPWDSEFGRMCVVADSTGAAVTLCGVDEPVVEGHEGDPLEGIDLSNLS